MPIRHSITSNLKILRYNVHTTEDIVMALLLADPRISEFTVFAVQEPWRNPHILTTHNPSFLNFSSLLPPLKWCFCLFLCQPVF
jgi:hypothetical protein